MTYSDKLKDPRWQKKRLQVFDRDQWTCQSCGDSTTSLHIHHLQYQNVEPWEYEDYYLITYCELCHNTEHLIGSQIRESLSELIDSNKIYIKPLSQICILIEKYPPFYDHLKKFISCQMIEWQKSKLTENAEQNTQGHY